MGDGPPLDAPQVVERVLAAAAGHDFRTFVIGFARPEGYSREEHERRFRAVKIAAGEELVRRWPGRDVEFDRPDIRFNFRPDGSVDVEAAALFIAGRYRKLSRGIPASRWIHHRCRGQGCSICGHTGYLCGPSIQELAEGPILEATAGRATLFHGAGREDTDVRMLGRGRPFVMEVAGPVRRAVDLEAVRAAINRRAAGLAQVGPLAIVGPASVRLVKEAEAEKTYRSIVRVQGPIPPDAAERASALAGVAVRQLSPRRVAGRRGHGHLRMKRVVESRWLGPLGDDHLWEVRTQSGTYVKELISGDEGRTRPSLAEVFGVPCRSVALDVLEVHWDPPWEAPPDAAAGTGPPAAGDGA